MSKLSLALRNLGFKSKIKQFSTADIQQAVINNIYFAGYFQEIIIWQAINLINHNKRQKSDQTFEQVWGNNSKLAFLLIRKTLKKAGALQNNSQLFKAKYLLKNLFSEDIFEIEDIEDFIVYLICQNAFKRLANQERNEITQEEWTKIYHQQYIENAYKIGLVKEEEPLFKEYDETWVMGCGRAGAITRIKHLKDVFDSGVNVGEVRILSGNRELWVEIDNIGDVNEAKNYIINLANKHQIKFDKNQPFISRDVSGKTRTYMNYEVVETRKVTETIMMQELYKDIFGNKKFTTIDDISDSYRPTTQSTVENITKNIFQKRFSNNRDLSNKSKIVIMIVSNQPYSKRQKLTTQRVVNKILHHKISKKIIFDEIGKPAFNAPISTIHSEFAALISEQFWQHIKNTSHLKKRKRPPQKMIFSTKHTDISFIPPIPTD